MKKLLNFIFHKKPFNFQRIQNSCKHEEWIFDDNKKNFQCKNCETIKPLIVYNT